MATWDLRKSKIEKAFQDIYCVDLIETATFIHFRKGLDGTANSECGSDPFKVRKTDCTWSLAGYNCPSGKQVWIVSR